MSRQQFYGAASGAGKPKYGKLPSLALMFIALLLIGIALGQEIWRENKIQKQKELLASEITKYDKENNDLEKMLEYYKTLSYKDKAARSKLNMQMPGEKAILIDPAENKETVESTDLTLQQPNKDGGSFSNAQKWWDYFFGKK